MRVVATAALLAGGIDAASPARAAPAPQAAPTSLAPMRFLRVRSGGSACRTDCPEWISAEGKIVMGTADALARVIAALGDRRLPIFINSAGGSVQDAMAMGRLIRAKRLAVVVARTAIAPCAASARECGEARGSAESWGAYCASACTLVLAGGVERYVSPLSFVGVHQLTELVSKTQVKRLYSVRYFVLAGLKLELSRTLVGERRSTATTKRTADRSVDDSVGLYLAEMGVLDPVMKLTLATPARDVHWLTAEELETSRLATIWVDGASPIVDDAGASGLRGEPIDARSGAASLFVAKSASPLERPVEGRPAALEASFAYRRGGGTVFATLLARDSAERDAGRCARLGDLRDPLSRGRRVSRGKNRRGRADARGDSRAQFLPTEARRDAPSSALSNRSRERAPGRTRRPIPASRRWRSIPSRRMARSRCSTKPARRTPL